MKPSNQASVKSSSCRSCRRPGSRSAARGAGAALGVGLHRLVASAVWPSVKTLLAAAACRGRRPCRRGTSTFVIAVTGLHAAAAGGDRRVGARHLQRRDAVRQAAEALGRVGVEVARDAHVVGRLAHLLGPDVEVELLVDGVVGAHERARRGSMRAGVAVVVGLDVDRRRRSASRRTSAAWRRRSSLRMSTPCAQRGHQHHDLERRARLAVALRGEVELRRRRSRRGGHRQDVAVARVDRDERRRRVARVAAGARRSPRAPPAGA